MELKLFIYGFSEYMAGLQEDDIDWEHMNDVPLPPYQVPIINEGDLNHDEAQQIITQEKSRLRNPQLEQIHHTTADDRVLVGPPLTLEGCRTLCPTEFVKSTLFRPRDPSRQKDPKRRYQPKLSDLQHVGLSRVLMQRFVEKYRTIPNNHQIAVYFVQQVYCEDILGRQVQWENLSANMGVGRGRPEARKRARLEGTPIPRTKPIVLTDDAHELIQNFANEGIALMTQGYTTESIQETLHQALNEKAQLVDQTTQLQAQVLALQSELQRYKERFGELSPVQHTNDTFTEDELIGQHVNLEDL